MPYERYSEIIARSKPFFVIGSEKWYDLSKEKGFFVKAVFKKGKLLRFTRISKRRISKLRYKILKFLLKSDPRWVDSADCKRVCKQPNEIYKMCLLKLYLDGKIGKMPVVGLDFSLIRLRHPKSTPVYLRTDGAISVNEKSEIDHNEASIQNVMNQYRETFPNH